LWANWHHVWSISNVKLLLNLQKNILPFLHWSKHLLQAGHLWLTDSYLGSWDQKDLQGQPRQIVWETPISKITTSKRTGGMAQVLQCLLFEQGVLSSNSHFPFPQKRNLLLPPTLSDEPTSHPKNYIIYWSRVSLSIWGWNGTWYPPDSTSWVLELQTYTRRSSFGFFGWYWGLDSGFHTC
jgi:hypothetical protein